VMLGSAKRSFRWGVQMWRSTCAVPKCRVLMVDRLRKDVPLVGCLEKGVCVMSVTNRIRLVLFGMQNRILDTNSAAINWIIIPVVLASAGRLLSGGGYHAVAQRGSTRRRQGDRRRILPAVDRRGRCHRHPGELGSPR
jgi:hypothetical protein